MAVSLRDRPTISGKDAERFIKKIQENNNKHQKLMERLITTKYNVKGTGIR